MDAKSLIPTEEVGDDIKNLKDFKNFISVKR